jgi:chromosome segregation ATPase
VTNERLDGIRDVTAAHEMLHVAYARLGDAERQKVDTLLSAEYDKLKNDSALSDRVAFYDRTEPGERMNELHSILGTEVGSLDGELENYYQKYFTDRNKVVSLHARYIAVFDELKTKSDALSQELNTLTDTINARMVAYNSDVESLNKAIASFNQRAAGGSFASEEAFESERAELVARSSSLESERVAIDDMITRYESLRSELTSIASQSDVLNRSIDSTLAPAPSV